MDAVQYDICRTQRELYEYVWNNGYDTKTFSDLFLRSEFCRRSMDTKYSRFQMALPEDILDYSGIDMSTIPKTDRDVTFDCAGWIGFTYRQLHFCTGHLSCDLSIKVPFERLATSFPGLHTIDEELVAELIIHDYKL